MKIFLSVLQKILILLNAIYKLKKYKIIFPLNNETLVTSLPCKNIKEFVSSKKKMVCWRIGVPVSGYLIMAYRICN